MTQFKIKSALVALFLLAGTSFCGAQTVTVGPTGNYPNMCAAAPNLTDGETVTVDANGGVPYSEHDCLITANNLTISGINGRPIIDGAGLVTNKGLWLINGHDIVIDNFEFRNSGGNGNSSDAMRIQSGQGTPDGANVTLQHCYIHDDTQGLLIGNAGDNLSGVNQGEWYSSAPYVKLLYNEFAYDGNYSGQEHNIYDGWDSDYSALFTFTAEYNWSHDSLIGDVMRCRSPQCDIYYNMLTDTLGYTNFVLDLADGGSLYVVGNVIYKSQSQQSPNGVSISPVMVTYRQATQSDVEVAYPVPYQDVHFINNTLIDAESGSTNQAFVNVECFTKLDQTQCPAPQNGATLMTTPGVYENNIMLGYPQEVTNDLSALVENNVTLYKTQPTDANIAALHFANPDVLDFHITSGSSAIGAGIYPPTDNTGAADPNAMPQYEFSFPFSQGAAWPTPSGNAMDAGAYFYPPPTAPSLNLTYTHTVTAPTGTGTITVTGLPTPPAGKFNYAVFLSTNVNAIPTINSANSSTSSITGTFTTVPVAATTVVPIYIYVDGTVLTASVTVNPGPATLASITQDNNYTAATTVHMNGPSSTPLTIDLSTSDSSVIYAPATVTLPANSLSVETGTLLGSLWGRSIPKKSATVTATLGSGSVQGTFSVTSPFINYFECIPTTCATHAIGGQSYHMTLLLGGYAPVGGAVIDITSSNQAAIPNQEVTIPAGDDQNPAGTYITTNAVSASTPVTLTANFNGTSHVQTGTVTVDPDATGTNVVADSGSGQIEPVGTAFPSPLAVTVTNAGTPVSGTTVTFSGTGVSFPSGATAVTDSNGNAQVTAKPTSAGALSITATVSGGNAPATFTESAYGPASQVVAVSGSGQSAYVGFNFASPLVAEVEDAGGNPVPGKTVNFSGTGLSFPSGASGTSDSNGQVSVTAEPTSSGSLTASASVSGVSGSASFPETGQAVVGIGPNGGAIDCGSSTAVGGFQADELFVGGSVSSTVANTIDTSGVTNPAPQAVYQVQRYGNFSYVIPELTPNASYTVRLHFSENYDTGAGQREFNVSINGTQVLTNFDIYATAGAEYKAVVESFPVTADSNGQITIQLTSVISNPFLAGIEILPATGGPASVAVVSGSGQSSPVGTPFANPLVTIVKDSSGNPLSGVLVTYSGTGVSFPSGNTATTGSNGEASVTAEPTESDSLSVDATVSGVASPAVFSETGTSGGGRGIDINSGGSATGSWVADEYYSPSPGSTISTANTIDTSGVTNPAPQAVYQDSRYAKTYTIPGLTVGGDYTVRLHFAELAGWGCNGGRLFNVTINGVQVLTSFDICDAAGAAFKAVAESFTTTADSNGKITLQFTSVKSNPILAGIEIQPATDAPTSVAVVSGSGQTSPVGTPFTNPLVTIVKDSNGDPLSGVLVTYAGSGVSFPNGATATTDSNGEASVTAEPTVSGSLTVNATVSGVSGPAVFSETGTAVVTDVIAIDSGGPASSNWVADEDFSPSPGSTQSTANTIDTSGVTNPAPQAVYQNLRNFASGGTTYTIPGLTANANYTVRLHFAEIAAWACNGTRKFNVSINGTQVLSNFNICDAAGGVIDKAVVESFPATANGSGQIIVQLNSVTNTGIIAGIEIQQ